MSTFVSVSGEYSSRPFDPTMIRPLFILPSVRNYAVCIISRCTDFVVHAGQFGEPLDRLRTISKNDTFNMRTLSITGHPTYSSFTIITGDSEKLLLADYDSRKVRLIDGLLNDFVVDYTPYEGPVIKRKLTRVSGDLLKELWEVCRDMRMLLLDEKTGQEGFLPMMTQLLRLVDDVHGNASPDSKGVPVAQTFVSSFRLLKQEFDSYCRHHRNFHEDKIFAWRFYMLAEGLLYGHDTPLTPMPYLTEPSIDA